MRKLTLNDVEDYQIEVFDSDGHTYAEGQVVIAYEKGGEQLTDEELDYLNDVGSPDWIQELAVEQAREAAMDSAELYADLARDAEMGL